jgi:hypothetical protein
MWKNSWLLYQNWYLSSNWMILWEQWGTNQQKAVNPRTDRVVKRRQEGSLKADWWVIFGNKKHAPGHYLWVFEFRCGYYHLAVGTDKIFQKTETVIIRKSQWCALYFHGIMHKSCFSIKLNHLAPKDDNNHCGSVMLREWNDQHSCRPLTCKGMDGTFKLWYFARYTVHLILVQKG